MECSMMMVTVMNLSRAGDEVLLSGWERHGNVSLYGAGRRQAGGQVPAHQGHQWSLCSSRSSRRSLLIKVIFRVALITIMISSLIIRIANLFWQDGMSRSDLRVCHPFVLYTKIKCKNLICQRFDFMMDQYRRLGGNIMQGQKLLAKRSLDKMLL